MLRLLRLLRVLKLVKALPELRIIIEAIISGFTAISFVTVILFIFFYLWANIGMLMFSQNDPSSFGNLQSALQTLFRLSTFDTWSSTMYTNMVGCDHWMYGYGRVFGETTFKNRDHSNCNFPSAWGYISVAYFVFFEVIGSMVLLTLFIGIVCTAMEEAKEDRKEEKEGEARLKAAVKALKIDYTETFSNLCTDVFTSLLTKGSDVDNKVEIDQVKFLVTVLPSVATPPEEHESFPRTGPLRRKSTRTLDPVPSGYITRLDVDKLLEVLKGVDPNFEG